MSTVATSILTQSERTVLIKRSRRGNLLRLIKEKYQRQDIMYGALKGKALSEKQFVSLMDEKTPRKTIGVLSSDILLQEIDLLEQLAPMATFIVTQSALSDVKNQNLAAFKRNYTVISNSSSNVVFMPDEHVMDIIERREENKQCNDTLAESIKFAAIHFEENLPEEYHVVVVSNTLPTSQSDDDVQTITMRTYMEKYVLPDQLDSPLFDVLSSNTHSNNMEVIHDNKTFSNDVTYTPYLSTDEINDGLRTGKYFRGTLRVQKDKWQECYVMVYNFQGQSRVPITIKGKENVNRALDGDIVVVEVFDQTDANTTDDVQEESDDEDDEVVIASSEAPVTALDLEALSSTGKDASSVATSKEAATTTTSSAIVKHIGRVIGIIKRSHASFVCSIDKEYDSLRVNIDINNIDPSAPVLHMIRCIPVNKRLPPIFITLQESNLNLLLNCRIVVALDLWPERSLLPIGHYVRNMGLVGDKDVETDVLLQELLGTGHSIKDGSIFSSEVMACVPTKDEWMEYMEREAWKSSHNIHQQQSAIHIERLDLRHLPIMSVDPPGCKDIDDALHCIWLDNGHIQAGVHIADVSHYVLPDSPLDLEAAKRSTSVYLVNKRIDMLPEALTTTICSLRSEEDHLTMSVLWELDLEGNIYNVTFHKSVIRSKASLTYGQAQARLDEAKAKNITASTLKKTLLQKRKDKGVDINDPAYQEDEVSASLLLLFELSEVWHRRRIENGALTLSSGQEVRFQFEEPAPVTAGDKTNTSNFGPKGDPTGVTAYQMYATNRMVEEWMLLANITVAKKILQQYPTASVLRRHAAPRRSQLEPLVLLAKKRLDIDIDISTSKTLAMSLDNAAEVLEARERENKSQIQGSNKGKGAGKGKQLVKEEDVYTPRLPSKGVQQLLRIMTTRCMQPAQYFCSGESSKEQWFHYGLAAPVYTHFTSPIRRYADILVHRLLSASLGLMSLPASALDRMRSQEVCVHMNRRHRAAQLAQRASTQLYTTLYFKERARKIVKDDSDSSNMDVVGDDEDTLNARAAEEVDAFVMSIESDSLIVLIPRFGLEGRLTLPTSNDRKEVVVNYDQGAGYVQICRKSTGEEALRITCFQTIRCKVSLVATGSKKSDSNDRSPLKIFFVPPATYFA